MNFKKKEIHAILSPFLQSRSFYRIWLFGSRATGKNRPYSDVDLLIEVNPPFSELEKESLRESFEESDLPFQFDVVFEEDLAEEYRCVILKTRKLLLP